MKVFFSTYAKFELEDAERFYELDRKGLGKKFKADVREAMLRISEYPEAWPVERQNIRKCLLRKFPYKLLYSVEENHIAIIAVAHQCREPNYWFDR